jgi:hypothetical protein
LTSFRAIKYKNNSDTLTISDVDSNDNPISFNDQISSLGTNGFGNFELTAGVWTYTLNNAHAARGARRRAPARARSPGARRRSLDAGCRASTNRNPWYWPAVRKDGCEELHANQK